MKQLVDSMDAERTKSALTVCCCHVPVSLKASLVTNKAFTESADEITIIHVCQAAVSPLLHRNVSWFR